MNDLHFGNEFYRRKNIYDKVISARWLTTKEPCYVLNEHNLE